MNLPSEIWLIIDDYDGPHIQLFLTCKYLNSINPHTHEIIRIKRWIDRSTLKDNTFHVTISSKQPLGTMAHMLLPMMHWQEMTFDGEVRSECISQTIKRLECTSFFYFYGHIPPIIKTDYIGAVDLHNQLHVKCLIATSEHIFDDTLITNSDVHIEHFITEFEPHHLTPKVQIDYLTIVGSCYIDETFIQHTKVKAIRIINCDTLFYNHIPILYVQCDTILESILIQKFWH